MAGHLDIDTVSFVNEGHDESLGCTQTHSKSNAAIATGRNPPVHCYTFYQMVYNDTFFL